MSRLRLGGGSASWHPGRRAPVAVSVLVAALAAIVLIGTTGAFSPSPPEGEEVRAEAPSTTVSAPTTSTSTPATTTTPPTTLAPTTVVPTTVKPTTVKPTTVKPTTTVKRTTTTQPPTTVAPAPVVAAPPPAPGAAAYAGTGVWVDAFDFDPAHSNQKPAVTPASVDAMASAGAKTIYIQAARSQDDLAPADLMAPDLLAGFLTQAHARGMAVVAWYLPKFAEVAEEQRHLSAILNFAPDGHLFDGVALDIEWRAGVPDDATRSARVVDLSRWLRAVAPTRPLGAIVVTPVVTDVISPAFWPGFPWADLVSSYDVWMPMGYWTDRKSDSPYRDAYTNTTETVRLLRGHVGNVAIHAVGGIGNTATDTDYSRFAAACHETGVMGRSIYDWATAGAKGVTAIAG